MERAHAYRLMDASTVVRNLSPMGDNSGMVLSNSQYEIQVLPRSERRAYQFMHAAGAVANLKDFSVLPAREAHVAPLTALEPTQRRQAWAQVVGNVGNFLQTVPRRESHAACVWVYQKWSLPALRASKTPVSGYHSL